MILFENFKYEVRELDKDSDLCLGVWKNMAHRINIFIEAPPIYKQR